MQKAEADVEPGGWIEGGLLALDSECSLWLGSGNMYIHVHMNTYIDTYQT